MVSADVLKTVLGLAMGVLFLSCDRPLAGERDARTLGGEDLDVKVIHAIEHGPLILETKVVNRTGKDLTFNDKLRPRLEEKDLPKDWVRDIPEPGIRMHRKPSYGTSVSSGETYRSDNAIQDLIDPLRGERTIRWNLSAGSSDEPPQVYRSRADASFLLTVKPATPENLRALLDDIRARILEASGGTTGDTPAAQHKKHFRHAAAFDHYTRWLLGTPHPLINAYLLECLDVDFPGLANQDSANRRMHILRTLFSDDPRLMKAAPETFGLVVNYLASNRPKYALDIFYRVSRRENERAALFRKVAGDRLRKSSDLWVRYLWNTSVEIDNREADLETLARDIAHAMDPFPEKTLRESIDGLDSERYAEREAASRTVVGYGRRVLPQLRKALDAKPSAEVKSRLERCIEHLERESLTPTELGIAYGLADPSGEPGRRVAAALLSQDPPSLMAEYLRRTIDRNK